jgi:hypothetical protein
MHFSSVVHIWPNKTRNTWYGMVWYGMVWYGMVWYGMVWYGMVWYGKTLFKNASLDQRELLFMRGVTQ